MRRKLMWVLALSAVIVGAAAYVGNVLATPLSGFSATTIAVGRFGEIDANNHVFFPDDFLPPGSRKPLALAPEDKRALRPVCPEQRLGAGGNHRLAHPPRSQPDHRHRRDCDGL